MEFIVFCAGLDAGLIRVQVSFGCRALLSVGKQNLKCDGASALVSS